MMRRLVLTCTLRCCTRRLRQSSLRFASLRNSAAGTAAPRVWSVGACGADFLIWSVVALLGAHAAVMLTAHTALGTGGHVAAAHAEGVDGTVLRSEGADGMGPIAHIGLACLVGLALIALLRARAAAGRATPLPAASPRHMRRGLPVGARPPGRVLVVLRT